MDIGRTIHGRRKRMGLTLEVLARGSGVSRAMLSDVERGRRSPTIKILSQIAVGLGCRTAELVEEPGPETVHVEPADQHPLVLDDATGVIRRTLAAPLLARGLEVVRYELPAGSWMRRSTVAVRYGNAAGASSLSFPPNPYGTVEHVTVARGSVELLAGDVQQTLGPGDSINYRLTQEIELRNDAHEGAELALIIDTRYLARD